MYAKIEGFVAAIVNDLIRNYKNIAGIKSSNADLANFQEYLGLRHNLSILIGCDKLAYAALLLGAQGVISGPGTVFPEIYALLIKTARSKGHRLSVKCQSLSNQIINLLRGGNDLSLYKKALEVRGFDIELVRTSLCDLNTPEMVSSSNAIRQFLENKYVRVIRTLSQSKMV